MGGWLAPWGIEYRVDYLSALVLLLITGVASAVMPFAYHSVISEVSREKHRLFYTAYLLTFAGLLGMVMTGDAFNAFVFMEIASLSAYVLIGLGRNRRALYASFQYLVLGTIGATFFLIGVGLLYMLTGTLNMVDLSERLSGQHDNRVLFAAFSFLVVGLSLKLALFPLHLWLPNSYAYAPSIVTVLLAATGTKVAVYLLLRFGFTVLQVNQHHELLSIIDLLLPLALIGMFAGSIVAIYQTDIKRLLAYSSISQIGYILLGIALASERGLIGAIVHVFNHGVMKAGLFVAVGAIALHAGGSSVNNLAGLGKRMPLTMAAFTVCALSLIGIPGTVGFISKWYLVLAALETGTTRGIIAAIGVISASLVAIIYVWRLVEVAYFTNPSNVDTSVTEASWPTLLSLWILAGSCLVFGLATDLTVGVSRLAARMLLGIS
jgi:multicomponent Na+:H+ antiporter subunit D